MPSSIGKVGRTATRASFFSLDAACRSGRDIGPGQHRRHGCPRHILDSRHHWLRSFRIDTERRFGWAGFPPLPRTFWASPFSESDFGDFRRHGPRMLSDLRPLLGLWTKPSHATLASPLLLLPPPIRLSLSNPPLSLQACSPHGPRISSRTRGGWPRAAVTSVTPVKRPVYFGRSRRANVVPAPATRRPWSPARAVSTAPCADSPHPFRVPPISSLPPVPAAAPP